ncbi:MAG: branched-chain amino acid ABC transporter permease [Alphaproteobacteria bacterium]|nr:branched-chain amino acid ABC transporter permease [Alphaproteobacteria bacterium]
MTSALHVSARPGFALAGAILLLVLPLGLLAVDQPFYIVLASRILVFALIASSLNLLIGYGGMISFGHAAFVGIGAYTVAGLMQAGIVSAWLAWPIAMLAGAVLALGIGWISLRTSGVYFIMITLAFAQMAYYAIISLKLLGGDDGLSLGGRSALLPGIDLKADLSFYYVALACFAASLAFLHRLINAELGRALQGVRDNETRMEALGFPTYRIKLAAFIIAGALAGLGGALLANLTGLVSPSLLHWTQSGALMIMVILGGAGRLLGGAIGAAVLLIIEEVLRDYTIHWQLGVGVVLLAIVLFAPSGLAGGLAGLRQRRQA